MKPTLAALACVAVFGLLGAHAQRRCASALVAPDVVIFIADDVADSDIDYLVPTAANEYRDLPNIHALAGQGLRLRAFYSHAWCAPTRDSLMFSKWLGRDHGIWSCRNVIPESLDFSAHNMARMFDDAGYHTAHFGKWHHGVPSDGSGWATATQAMGFDTGRTMIATIPPCGDPQPAGERATTDGVVTASTADMDLRIRDSFLVWWANTPSPRFAMVSFPGAHYPLKFPSFPLLPIDYPTIPATDRAKFEAELIGVDTALGAMLAVMDAGDYRIFMGDNGTAPGTVRPDQDPNKVKSTCYQDGVRVPFVVAGPGIPSGIESADLASVVDLLPTFREMLGLSGPPVDGISLFSTKRDIVFCYGPEPVGSTVPLLVSAVIGVRWKLLQDDFGAELLFDLQSDPAEMNPLAPVGPIAAHLRARRVSILGR